MRSLVMVAMALAAAGCLFAAGAGGPKDARKRRFAAADRKAALAWQRSSRALLAELLKLTDLIEAERAGKIPLRAKVLSTKEVSGHTLAELELSSTPGRRMRAVLTVPRGGGGKRPAVVCIHGHSGNRWTPVRTEKAYRRFGHALTRRGFVTISTDVGQHKVHEEGRTLVGERLWDLMRCVSYLSGRSDVDAGRIGCAGLSLGGEMAMWLAAMDTRVAACVSSGFLTTVANMRRGHCPCWEFDGLTEHFDFADVYILIAPRPLMCQNGRREPRRGGFPVDVARGAFAEIHAAYGLFDAADRAVLAIHDAGHVIDLPSLLSFLESHLALAKGG